MLLLFYFPRLPRPPITTLFPYTTLFRSNYGERDTRIGISPEEYYANFERALAKVKDQRLRSAIEARWFYVYQDRKSTRLNSSHLVISYAVFCLKKKKTVYMTNIILPTRV